MSHMYNIQIINDPTIWENFNRQQLYSAFVQSPSYGTFYEELGEEYTIVGLYDDETLIGGSLVLSTHAKRGNFLYLPYGPILDYSSSEQVDVFFSYMKKYAKESGYDFVRISPLVDTVPEIYATLKKIGLRPAPMHVLAENTWILDLSKSEEILLKEMKKNHRNLIRKCIKKEVVVEKRTDNSALKELNAMHDIVAERHDFTRFSREYINTEFAIFKAKNEALIMHAYLPSGELDSSSIMIFYGNIAVYRHSASLMKNNKIPTSYAIQWETIKEAKKRGCRWYNFWGVAPDDATKDHPFYGISKFKKGFGGFQKDLIHCHDLPITKKYWLNWCVETIRKYKRGF